MCNCGVWGFGVRLWRHMAMAGGARAHCNSLARSRLIRFCEVLCFFANMISDSAISRVIHLIFSSLIFLCFFGVDLIFE